MRIGVSLYDEEHAAAALRAYAALVPTLPRHVGWHAALKHDMPALPFVRPEMVGRSGRDAVLDVAGQRGGMGGPEK